MIQKEQRQSRSHKLVWGNLVQWLCFCFGFDHQSVKIFSVNVTVLRLALYWVRDHFLLPFPAPLHTLAQSYWPLNTFTVATAACVHSGARHALGSLFLTLASMLTSTRERWQRTPSGSRTEQSLLRQIPDCRICLCHDKVEGVARRKLWWSVEAHSGITY